jgi:hypothetical protein
MLRESLVCQKMWPSTRVVDIGKSQPAKNYNLSRLISNLSRLKKTNYPVLVLLPRNLPYVVS